jgi:ribonuclease HI
MTIDCFVDSSFDDHRKICGLGLYIRDGIKQKAISNWIPAENNNTGEMMAIYLSCILMNGKQGTIHTDSQVALSYIRGEIRDKPRTREQYIRHKQLELMAYKIRKALPEGVEIVKTKAHTHHFQTDAMGNELADVLAKSGRTRYYEQQQQRTGQQQSNKQSNKRTGQQQAQSQSKDR